VFRLIENEEALREGIVFLGNTSGVGWANFSREIESVILDCVQHRMPVRIRHIYVVNPPWFINAVFAIISLFLTAKTKAKRRLENNPFLQFNPCRVVSQAQLQELLPPASIPTELGGTFEGSPDVLRQRLRECVE
jgi:hypothetical protein